MRRALLSVYDKEGLIPFAQGMMEMGIELIATSGTLKHLVEAGIIAVDISNVIGMPPILSGRIKTIHPKLHGGILADRDKIEHMTQMRNLGLVQVDIVVVNMNAFLQPDSLDELMDGIDLGGPALIRSAARNYQHVVAVSNPEQYPVVLKRLKNKTDDEKFRANLATIAFSATARYDAMIASYMAARLHTHEMFPNILPGHYIREAFLPSGENEHQRAAFYRNLMSPVNNIVGMKKTIGTEIVGATILNIDMAWELVTIFKKPSAAIVRHCSVVGMAIQDTIVHAFAKAHDCDRRAAYGGLIAANRPVGEAMAQLITENENFFEGIIAPGYDDKALEILSNHPVWGDKFQIIEMPAINNTHFAQPTLRAFREGLLLEEEDEIEGEPSAWRIVTRVRPKEHQLVDMAFALAIASASRSAAAIIVKDSATLGIGSGQACLLDSIAMALSKAGTHSREAIMAIDEPCLFPEAIKLAYENGISAIIQPRDSSKMAWEVIGAANEFGIPVVFCKNCHRRY